MYSVQIIIRKVSIYFLTFKSFCRPQQLELTAVNEMVLMDNIDIFKMNGFDFEFQPDGKFFFKLI